MLNFLSKIFPSKSDRDVRELEPLVEEINQHFNQLSTLSDDELRNKTAYFKALIASRIDESEKELAGIRESLKGDLSREERLAAYDRMGELEREEEDIIADTLDEILPEAFAVVKEACRRHVGQSWEAAGTRINWQMTPFDVQLMGGAVLHHGKIAEMATGEGKTLVATLPVYLNALCGRGVHLVTVNDYLAKRDSEWMGKIFEFLGLTVGVILQQMDPSQRRNAYNCDITYGTNNEFGFDFLRDNMVIDARDLVQRPHWYAVVDEVDSVLVDEARTPLIISGPVDAPDDQRFLELKPRVDRVVNAQKNLVASIVAEAERYIGDEKKKKELGVCLLRAQRGMPKNKKLMKLLSDPDLKRLMQQTELEYLADSGKRMHEIDDELHYYIDEKSHIIDLTEKGREHLAPNATEKDFFVLPDVGTEVSKFETDDSFTAEQKALKRDELNLLYAERSDRIHTVTQLLRAYSLYEKDDEYVIEDGKVMIVDEFTGRLMHGRRYSDGLHQAIEAKENVTVERDTQTMATITLQNYFRLYKKLSGMTGTAETEAAEFFEIYKLDVVVIPTNQQMVRKDHDDKVYRTKREKYNAVLEEIDAMRTIHRPTLVGTTSVEVSETISRMLQRKQIPHNVLNAKQHQREAEIVANAGLPGAVTIATNMAGRGTDIKLGTGVAEAGGLHIVGTERHESRRIDRQLRGRAGRQGDPGSSQFFLSLEDDLMRLFGSDRIAGVMQRLGLKEGEVIQHAMITRSVERAQKKVEENNFAIRKRLLEYDNTMNSQREVIYDRRHHALVGERVKDEIFEMFESVVRALIPSYHEEGDYQGFIEALRARFLVEVDLTIDRFREASVDELFDIVVEAGHKFYTRKEETIGVDLMAQLERSAILSVIDEKWKEHLREMDDLKEGIGLRAYGQKDPLIEYKREGYELFATMLTEINERVLEIVFKAFPANAERELEARTARPRSTSRLKTIHDSSQGLGLQAVKPAQTSNGEQLMQEQQAGKPATVHVAPKVGRNDPCPCGSGKKYKNCHGAGA